MKNPKRGVTVLGAYGADNAGDDAALRSVVQAMREFDRDIPVRVIGKRPKRIEKYFGVSAMGRLSVVRIVLALKRSRLFILGGGSLLQDATSSRSLWYYLAVTALAKKCGCAVQIYGGGLGPVRRAKNAVRCERVLDGCADVLCLRDGRSVELLRRWGVTKPRVIGSADPAFRLELPAMVRKPCLGVIVRDWDGFWYHVPDFAHAARYAYEKYGLSPVFFPFGPGDARAAKSVMADLEGVPCRISNDPKAVAEMSAVVSMRLHGLIFAVMAGVSAAGVSYDEKVAAFCRENGLGCTVLRDVTAERLCALIDRAMAADGEQILETRERLRRAERVNAETAWELLQN